MAVWFSVQSNNVTAPRHILNYYCAKYLLCFIIYIVARIFIADTTTQKYRRSGHKVDPSTEWIGLGWIWSGYSGNFMDWIRLGGMTVIPFCNC